MSTDRIEEPPGVQARTPDGEAFRADCEGKATDQVGRDLRDSAETMRNLLNDAFQRLHRLDRDSPVTALVAQAVERFQQVHRDIEGVASNLDSAESERPVNDRPPESPPGS